MRGTSQGNQFFGDNSQDTSCFVIRELKIEKVGVMIKGSISILTVQRAALVFIDDTNLYTNRMKSNERIQKAVDLYSKLFEATRGAIYTKKLLLQVEIGKEAR